MSEVLSFDVCDDNNDGAGDVVGGGDVGEISGGVVRENVGSGNKTAHGTGTVTTVGCASLCVKSLLSSLHTCHDMFGVQVPLG